ncbi:Hypothetical protein PBC10988_0580 [Planctomycetales bacterium 10988]|nr:Hypothetical protein PBC10988_0580 [Planctomycetales bacterium 10988]
MNLTKYICLPILAAGLFAVSNTANAQGIRLEFSPGEGVRVSPNTPDRYSDQYRRPGDRYDDRYNPYDRNRYEDRYRDDRNRYDDRDRYETRRYPYDRNPNTQRYVRPSERPQRVETREWFLGVELVTTSNGALMKNVINNTPADRAGLREGDVILAINDQKVTSSTQAIRMIQNSNGEVALRILNTKTSQVMATRVPLQQRVTYSQTSQVPQRSSQPGVTFSIGR